MFTPESSEHSYDEKRAHLDALIARCDERLLRMQPGIIELLDARHALSPQNTSLFDVAHPTLEQIYEEPGYNDSFVYGEDRDGNGGDLDTRHGKGFGKGETFEEGEYANLILHVAAELGILRAEVVTASDPLDERIGIADSNLGHVGAVEAVVVPAAAGISNTIRIRDAIRNIESGSVETKRLIIATCERKVDPGERERLAAKGFRGGQTESESVRMALEDLLDDTKIEGGETIEFPVRFTSGEFQASAYSQVIQVGGNDIELVIVSTEYDTKRKKSRTQLADRADTFETYVAVNEILEPGAGKLLIDSHDTWAAGQGIVAEQVFGRAGKDILVTGAQKLDRVKEIADGQLGLSMPEAVVDEIAKNYAFLAQERIMLLNERARLDREELALKAAAELGVTAEFIERQLVLPMPDMTELRDRKRLGYKDIAIDRTHERFNEDVVSVHGAGIAGQNYYSRPNATVDEPIPGVETVPLLRTSTAETLSLLNRLIAHPSITKLFGGEVELYVEDGLRTRETQQKLYEEEVPALLTRNHPDWSAGQIAERRDDIIAPASFDDEKPSPHSTGAAVDVILRYKTTKSPLFVSDRNVWIGHPDGSTGDSIHPDYFEGDNSDLRAQQNRRAFYAIMTGRAFGIETDLVVNPSEIWHWSGGDQLWAMITGAPRAYYGPVTSS